MEYKDMSPEQQKQIMEKINPADNIHVNVALCHSLMTNILNTECKNELQRAIIDKIKPCVKALQNTLLLTQVIINQAYDEVCKEFELESTKTEEEA